MHQGPTFVFELRTGPDSTTFEKTSDLYSNDLIQGNTNNQNPTHCIRSDLSAAFRPPKVSMPPACATVVVKALLGKRALLITVASTAEEALSCVKCVLAVHTVTNVSKYKVGTVSEIGFDATQHKKLQPPSNSNWEPFSNEK